MQMYGCYAHGWGMIGLGVEALCVPAPNFPPPKGRLFREGLRYQARVARRLRELGLGATLHEGVWLSGPCQPDFVLEFSTSLLIIETKLSAVDALQQMRKYKTALAPLRKQVWMVQIARNVSAAFPPTIPSLYDVACEYEIIHWWM